MQKRVNQKTTTPPVWLQLVGDEKLLFCGTSPAEVKNPVSDNARHPECVVLTDRRLVSLCPLRAGSVTPAVTSIPLSQIQVIQTTALSWSATSVIGIVLGFVPGFFLLCIPGIVGLIYMLMNIGPRVNVLAGNLRVEIKFSPHSPGLLREFLALINLHTSLK
jgi:hypothetical protein